MIQARLEGEHGGERVGGRVWCELALARKSGGLEELGRVDGDDRRCKRRMSKSVSARVAVATENSHMRFLSVRRGWRGRLVWDGADLRTFFQRYFQPLLTEFC